MAVAIFLSPFATIRMMAQVEAETSVDEQLSLLKDADLDVRIEALRALQVSLDPRLPEAMLPLLSDEGNSIRRLAARAIGSRWWQISRDRVEVFVAALAKNRDSERDDEKNMVHRAIGLLSRKYDGDMFARSANGRWVVYERRGLPCLIDTTNGSEELLGWDENEPGWLTSAWGNGALAESVNWHPKAELCVFEMLLHRKASTLWVWRHGKGLRRMAPGDFLKPLGVPEEKISWPGGFFTEFIGWTEGGIEIEVFFGVEEGTDLKDHTVRLEWLPEGEGWRVLSRKVEDP